MKKIVINIFVLVVLMLVSQQTQAQTERIVKIIGINPKDTAQTNKLEYDQIFKAITADAPNRVAGVITKYELQRGQAYLNVSSLTGAATTVGTITYPAFDLYFVASPIVQGATAQQNYNPVILASLTTTGGNNTILRPSKNLYMENIELDGLLPNGKLPARIIELNGLASTATLKGCKIQNNTQAHITLMVDDISLFISDCVIGNSGHLLGYGGNGRTIDNRAPTRVKQIVIQNSTFYNNTDRFIRSMLGQKISKFKLDHVSLFNSTGRHGCFQLARTDTVEITNNMIVNPLAFGDRVPNTSRTPIITYREEQTQTDKAFAVFTHDSTKVGQPVTQKVIIRNNNIYHEKKFEDFFNEVTAPDSVKTVRVLNNCLSTWAGSNTNDALWFREELKFNNTSSSDDLLAYVKEWNLNPKAATLKSYNFSTIFAFEWDVAYPTTSKSYTAGDNGFPLGDLNAWPERKAQWIASLSKAPQMNRSKTSEGINVANCYPNPFNNQITIDFTLEKDQTIEVSVFNSMGQKVKSLLNSNKDAGQYTTIWDGTNDSGRDLSNGMYFIQISGANGKVVNKIMKY